MRAGDIARAGSCPAHGPHGGPGGCPTCNEAAADRVLRQAAALAVGEWLAPRVAEAPHGRIEALLRRLRDEEYRGARSHLTQREVRALHDLAEIAMDAVSRGPAWIAEDVGNVEVDLGGHRVERSLDQEPNDQRPEVNP